MEQLGGIIMLNVIYTGRFKKDYKKCIKRGLDIDLLKSVVNILALPATLPVKNQDHDLKGNYKGRRECHITPDWLLIYEVDGNDLYLDRTGSHSDLFDE
jgi:mRNA interferase YafQ